MDMIATTFDIACSFRGMETAFRGSHGYYERASVVGTSAERRTFERDFQAERRVGLVRGFPNIAVLPDRPPNGSRLSCGALKKIHSPIYARHQLQALVRRRGQHNGTRIIITAHLRTPPHLCSAPVCASRSR